MTRKFFLHLGAILLLCLFSACGTKSQEGSTTPPEESTTLFDFRGNALPVFEAFKQ